MGLDSVELVMAVEEAFGIAIEDRDAEQMRTPGHIIEYVLTKAGRSNDAACLTQRSFHRLRAALMRHTSAKRSDINPDTQMDDLLPRQNREQMLALIFSEFELPPPELVRSPILVQSLFLGSIGAGCQTAILLWGRGGSPFWTCGMVVVFAGLLGVVLTRPLRIHLPAWLATVGDLSRWMVAHQPGEVSVQPRGWTREQVVEKVRCIVIEQLDCANAYHEDARFIEDLGMD